MIKTEGVKGESGCKHCRIQLLYRELSSWLYQEAVPEERLTT